MERTAEVNQPGHDSRDRLARTGKKHVHSHVLSLNNRLIYNLKEVVIFNKTLRLHLHFCLSSFNRVFY